MARGNFGERLKRERELREVSPNEVVVATRISLRFLEALENEDWDKLPGGVFNRGFVRAIARYLGLNEESLLAEYDLAHGDNSPGASSATENRIPAPPKWMAVLLVVAVLAVVAALVAAGIYGWRWYSTHRRTQASSARNIPVACTAQPASLPTGVWSSYVAPALTASTSPSTRLRILAGGKIVFDSETPADQNLL